jgi:hypothetical protein
MSVFLGIVSCVLLALVAGLLLTVGFWLYEFRNSYRKMPMLGEELTRQLMGARDALAGLQKTAKETGPELARQAGEAQKLLIELKLVIAKGEEVAARIDASRPAPQAAPLIHRTAADNATVTISENVVAAASASRDPLEELLAGLGSEPPQAEAAAKTDHEADADEEHGPPSQAEIQLRRTLAG